jgi:hypothetical protein
MRLPPYHYDAAYIELLEKLSWEDEDSPRLGCQQLYTLDYLKLCEELRPEGLTVSEIGWALNHPDQHVGRRLEELSKLRLVERVDVWEEQNSFFGQPERVRVSYWRLTPAGHEALIAVVAMLPPGPLSRPSALAE